MKVPHPAKYSDELLPVLAKYCYGHVLDPMGGVGKAGLLKRYNPDILSVTINELEKEWAEQSSEHGVDNVIVGDAKKITGSFDCIVTSPPYGNRMADNFKASNLTRRKMYVGDLGRNVSNGSVCCFHYGDKYQKAMIEIYDSILQNCQFQRFILNISNFIRQFKEVNVSDFFVAYFLGKRFNLTAHERVITRRQKGVGANTALRIPYENIFVFQREGSDPGQSIIQSDGE